MIQAMPEWSAPVRKRRGLTSEEKYEVFLEASRGDVNVGEVLRKWNLHSTDLQRIRETVRNGALKEFQARRRCESRRRTGSAGIGTKWQPRPTSLTEETGRCRKDQEFMMIVPLTPREIEFVLSWGERAFWPDEERVLRKLKRALKGRESPRLSRLQVQIMYGWGEEQTGGHYGGGAVGNLEERTIMNKLRVVLEGKG